MRRQSLQQLQAQHAVLEAELAGQAARLIAQQVPAEQFADALKPWSDRVVTIRRQILDATPPRLLMARLRALEQQLARTPPQDAGQQRAMATEIRDLQLHLSHRRRRPLTVKVALILATAVAAALWLPRMIVALLPP